MSLSEGYSPEERSAAINALRSFFNLHKILYEAFPPEEGEAVIDFSLVESVLDENERKPRPIRRLDEPKRDE